MGYMTLQLEVEHEPDADGLVRAFDDRRTRLADPVTDPLGIEVLRDMHGVVDRDVWATPAGCCVVGERERWRIAHAELRDLEPVRVLVGFGTPGLNEAYAQFVAARARLEAGLAGSRGWGRSEGAAPLRSELDASRTRLIDARDEAAERYRGGESGGRHFVSLRGLPFRIPRDRSAQMTSTAAHLRAAIDAAFGEVAAAEVVNCDRRL